MPRKRRSIMQNKLSTRVFCLSILTLLAAESLQAETGNSYSTYRLATLNKVFPHENQKLGFLYTSISAYTFQWVFIHTINRGLGRDIRGSDFKRWFRNVTTVPQIPDGDHWTTNYIGHPLLGATIYAFYKNRGFSDKASIAGTILQSTLFEYTVEGWKQPPSGVDLIVTPLIGSLVGWKIGMNSAILSSTYAVTKYILGLF